MLNILKKLVLFFELFSSCLLFSAGKKNLCMNFLSYICCEKIFFINKTYKNFDTEEESLSLQKSFRSNQLGNWRIFTV